MHHKLNFILSSLIILIGLDVRAQEGLTDEAFKIAQENVFKGDREKGKEGLRLILIKNPSYYDARILLARTYAWDKRAQQARNELKFVLARMPDHEDAISALIDVEIWDDQCEHALIVANTGLVFYPNSADFLFKKASILHTLERTDEALEVLNTLITLDPNHELGLALRKDLWSSKMKYVAGISYGLDLFSRTFNPAHFMAVQISRSNSWGTSILRLNHSSRFAAHGSQPEIDLYPKIAKGVYAYFNYGFSTSSLFARHRFGGEVYTKLPQSLEASAGMRYLYFSPGSRVFIYTGSLGWYFKNYWLSYRAYMTPNITRTSFSSMVSLRRYFADADSYLGFSGSFGFSPDDRRIQSGAGLSSDGIYLLKSESLGISWQKKIQHNFILNMSYSFIHQELSFDVGQYVWISNTLIGIKKKF